MAFFGRTTRRLLFSGLKRLTRVRELTGIVRCFLSRRRFRFWEKETLLSSDLAALALLLVWRISISKTRVEIPVGLSKTGQVHLRLHWLEKPEPKEC
jgi:hypothetical protein